MKMTGAEGPQAASVRPERAAETDNERPAIGVGWVATTATAAVNHTERMLCGDGLVSSAPVAEGMALAGAAAATLLAPSRDPTFPDDGPRAGVGWVHHRVGLAARRGIGSAAFELVAVDAEEAVRHSLAARRMVGLLGRPGVCTVDSRAAHRLAFVRLPDEQTASAVLSDRSARTGSVMAAAEQVLGSRGMLPSYRADDAELLLIAAGEDRLLAVRLADRLRRRGVACGVIGVALVDPFPVVQLRALLNQRVVVIVVTDLLEDGTARALRATGDTVVFHLAQRVMGELSLPAELTGRFPQTADEDGVAVAETDPLPTVTLAVDPADSAGERLLLEAATLLGRRGEFKITRAVFDDRAASGIVLGRGTTADDQTGRVDVGVLLCPSTVDGLDGGAILSRLDRKSTLLLLAADEQPARTWDALGAVRRAWIKRRRPTLRWQRLSTSGQAASIVSSIEESWLRGAFETDAAYEEAERGWVEVGVPRPITLEIDLLDEARETPSGSVGAQIEQPRMPAVSDAPTKEFSSPALRQFHLTGSVGTTEPHSPQTGPLLPLAGLAIAAPADAWRSYPFVLDAGETDPRHRPLADLLTHAIGRAQDSTGSALAVIDRSRTTVLRLAHRLLSVGEAPAETADLLRATLQQLPQELDLSEAGTAELQREIERLEPWLELTGRPIAFDQGALLELFVETVRGRRDGPRERFRDEVRARVDRLDELLRIDDSHGPAGSTAQALSSTLGAGERFVDPAALSRNLPGYRGARPIEPARRARMEAAVARLRSWLDRAANEADLVLVHTGSTALDRTPARCRVIRHPDALRSAIGLFDGHAAAMVDTVRALRVARLDVEGQYDPARHDALIGRLGPHGFSAEEMLQLPAIVVIEDERRLAGDALTSFSALLRSGRPVLVLASRAATDPMAPQEDGAGYVPCTGYLAIAHREAFVVQSTLARPRQLVDGFSRMAVSLRPAVALVTRPQWGAAIAPWSQMVFAWHARNPSGFCYDPSAGATWAERFDLTDNPQPEAGWPEQEAAYVDGRGRPGSIPQRFTAVHAAATDPASGEQFRLLSSDAWAEDQIEIADYLDLPDKQQLRRIPYLWVVRHDGELARAVVTREQACLALDDLRAWRVLQELAGYHNEYARRAASIARDESRAAARVERAQLTARHSEAIEQVRAAAAGETIDRLVAVLMDLESVAPSAKIVTATPAVLPVETDAEQSASEPTETVADAIPSEEISFDEPYIDTVLCTTCNECTNLNPRLFVYNDNRQATINDPAAGTFEDLVKAAEKCPARCIHPGAPRADDPTVNDDLLTRARAFR